jgi:hypothetical protein
LVIPFPVNVYNAEFLLCSGWKGNNNSWNAQKEWNKVTTLHFLTSSFICSYLLFRDGPGHLANFCGPSSIAVDVEGTIYVTDDKIRRITFVPWSKQTHKQLAPSAKNLVKTIMLIYAKRGNLIHRLPRDIVFLLFHWIL